MYTTGSLDLKATAIINNIFRKSAVTSNSVFKKYVSKLNVDSADVEKAKIISKLSRQHVSLPKSNKMKVRDKNYRLEFEKLPFAECIV